MDINDLRSISTILSLVCFVSIVIWAYSGKRKSAFDEAAALPIDDEEIHREAAARVNITTERNL